MGAHSCFLIHERELNQMNDHPRPYKVTFLNNTRALYYEACLLIRDKLTPKTKEIEHKRDDEEYSCDEVGGYSSDDDVKKYVKTWSQLFATKHQDQRLPRNDPTS